MRKPFRYNFFYLQSLRPGYVYLLAVTILISLSCSVKKMAIRSAVNVIAESRQVFEQETDLELAESAIGSNLKLLEVMQVNDPENEKILMLLAEIYSAYTLSFVEDKFEQYEEKDDSLSDYHRQRAIKLYLRARDYAGKVLLPRLGKNPQEMGEQELKDALAKLSVREIGPVFWYAFSWGSAINLDRQNMDALSQLNKIEVMMLKVKEWDEKYYYAGAWLFEGIYFGARSPTLGGNPERSKNSFETALRLTDGKLLVIPYFYARTYCIFTQNRKCFDENIAKVLSAPENILPEQMLANALARKKARRLQERANEYFVE